MMVSGNILVPMPFVLICNNVYVMMNSRDVFTVVCSVTGFASSCKSLFVATSGAGLAGVLFGSTLAQHFYDRRPHCLQTDDARKMHQGLWPVAFFACCKCMNVEVDSIV